MLSRSPASGPAKPRHPLLAASLDIYPVGNGDQTLLPPGVTQLWDAPQPPPRHRGFCAGEGLKQHKSLPSVAQAEIFLPCLSFPVWKQEGVTRATFSVCQLPPATLLPPTTFSKTGCKASICSPYFLPPTLCCYQPASQAAGARAWSLCAAWSTVASHCSPQHMPQPCPTIP